MSLRWRIVDPITLLDRLDLNNLVDGVSYGYQVIEPPGIDLSGFESMAEYVAGGGLGGTFTGFPDEPVQISWNQRMMADPAQGGDAIKTLSRRLAEELAAGGSIAYAPRDDASIVYIDFLPVRIPGLLRGGPDDLLDIGEGLHVVDYPLRLLVQPLPRLAPLDSEENLLDNPTLMEDVAGDGTPDGWTVNGSATNRSVEWPEAAWEFDVATAAAFDVLMQLTPDGSVVPGDSVLWAFEVRLMAGGAGAKMQAIMGWRTSADAAVGGAPTGPMTALTSEWQRLYIVGSPAPATTARVKLWVRVDNDNANPFTIQVRQVMAIKAIGLVPFRASSQLVTNEHGQAWSKHVWVYNPGQAPSPGRVSVLPEAGSSLVAVRFGIKGYEDSNLYEYVNLRKSFRVTDIVTSGNEGLFAGTVAGIALTEASGGTAARTDYQTGGANFQKRWRKHVIQTDRSSLQGLVLPYIHMLGHAGAARLQLRYGFSDETLLPYTSSMLPLYWATSPAGWSQDYTYFPFEPIRIPDGANLYIEGWLVRDSGALADRYWYWDTVEFMPLDDGWSGLGVLGFDSHVIAQDVWLGREGITPLYPPQWTPGFANAAGVDSGDSKILDAQGETVAIPSTTGQVLEAGRHVYRVKGTMWNEDGAQASPGRFKVYDITVTGSPVLKGGVETTMTRQAGPDEWEFEYEVEFDATGGNKYTAGVTFAIAGGNDRITVNQFEHDWIAPVDSPMEMRYDADRSGADTPLMDGLDRVGNLVPLGGPMMFPPGLSALMVVLQDLPQNGAMSISYFDGADPRGALAKAIKSRQARVRTVLHPLVLPE